MLDPFWWACRLKSECDEYYSGFRNHQTQNIEYYLVLRKTEYQVPNTIWYQESPNTEYKYYY